MVLHSGQSTRKNQVYRAEAIEFYSAPSHVRRELALPALWILSLLGILATLTTLLTTSIIVYSPPEERGVGILGNADHNHDRLLFFPKKYFAAAPPNQSLCAEAGFERTALTFTSQPVPWGGNLSAEILALRGMGPVMIAPVRCANETCFTADNPSVRLLRARPSIFDLARGRVNAPCERK